LIWTSHKRVGALYNRNVLTVMGVVVVVVIEEEGLGALCRISSTRERTPIFTYSPVLILNASSCEGDPALALQ
jgi:hypothetical protein